MDTYTDTMSIPSTQKKDDLKRRFEALKIYESDIDESFIKGSGSGGQKVNKTHSCVQLRHRPTNIVVKNQKTRSRESNRFFARRELADLIDQALNGTQSNASKIQQKKQKQKARRARRRLKKQEDIS